MIGFYRWVVKHKSIAICLSAGFLCFAYTLAFVLLRFPLWAILVADVFFIVISFVFPESCQNKLLKTATLEFDNHCNPYPLLQETQQLLGYKNTKVQQQLLLIDHCAALESVGEYQKVFDILSSINIDQYSGVLPIVKFVYYNNLMSIYTFLDKFDEANLLHSKIMLIYRDMKNKKQKAMLESVVVQAMAADCFRKQEYAKTIEILESKKANCLRMQVYGALLYARASILLNENERARDALTFVVNYGNQLFCVTEARNLLESLLSKQN